MLRIQIPDARSEAHRRAGHWQDRLVDSYVTQAATRRPNALAVIDRRVRLTYGQLERAIKSVAAGLARLGVTAGDVVSWQLPNWHEAIILHYAVLRLGAVSNPIVPIYRQREVSYILAQSCSRIMVIPHMFRGFNYLSMMTELHPALPELCHVIVTRPRCEIPELPFSALLTGDPADVPDTERSADDPILLMFTSGTTADPKGVLHTHNTLDYENRSVIDVYQLGDDDTVFMPSPLTHITGLLYGVQLPAMLAAPAVLQDIWDPTEALRLIAAEKCSFVVAATPFLHGLVHHPDLDSFGVNSLRVFACGGADVPAALIRAADDRLGCAATRVYGSTEFPTLCTSPPDAPQEVRAQTDGALIGAAQLRIVEETAKTSQWGIPVNSSSSVRSSSWPICATPTTRERLRLTAGFTPVISPPSTSTDR